MKKRLLLATLCDRRITTDDCAHRVVYRFCATSDGVEVHCRHTTIYGPPWATAEERKPQVEKTTVKCPEALAGALDKLRGGSFPVNPRPPADGRLYLDVSLKFGDGPFAVSYGWSLGNPPAEWKTLDDFANAALIEAQEWYEE